MRGFVRQNTNFTQSLLSLFKNRNNQKKIAQQAQQTLYPTHHHHQHQGSSPSQTGSTGGLIVNPMEQYEEMKCIPEVPEHDIEIVRKQWGASRYGEILLGRFRSEDDKNGTGSEESFVVLKALESDKLRSEFVHEMKSKWFISAKSERIAKLFGHVTLNLGGGRQQLAMVLECANCDLTQFLPACDKKSFG